MDALRLINYRCFSDTGFVDLKPINFLVGSNSSGKSSFIKMFPLLKQSLGIRRNGVFLWYGPEVDFKDYANVVKEGQDSMEIEFKINDFCIQPRGFTKSVGTTNLSFKLNISSRDQDFDYLHRLSIAFDDQLIEVEYTKTSRATAKIWINGNQTAEDFDKILTSNNIGLLPKFLFISGDNVDDYPEWCENQLKKISHLNSFVEYRKILKSLKLGSKKDVTEYLLKQFIAEENSISSYNKVWLNNVYILLHINDIIDGINLNLLNLENNISYVGPLRSTTQRYYRFQNYAVEEIDSDGQNLAMYLYNLNSYDKERFRKWTQGLFGFDVKVKAANGNMELLIQEKNKEQHNMVDVGFGYSQILPVLAMIWKAMYLDRKETSYSRATNRNEHIVAIEQPELHLHPRLQGLFAIMLVKIINEAKKEKYDIRFVLETHSEILITKIGELIAMGECNKDDVNVFLFNAKQEGLENYIEKSTYTDDGQLQNWPYGFFSDYVFEDRNLFDRGCTE